MRLKSNLQKMNITVNVSKLDSDSVKKYLAEIRKENHITAEEETILFERLQRGDENVRKQIICANLRFVVSIAKQYHNETSGIQLNDLINEGNDGLIEAVSRFDYTRGFKFISFAVSWIRQRILAYLEKYPFVVIPRNKQNTQRKISAKRNEIFVRHGIEWRQENPLLLPYTTSMDQPFSAESNDSLHDALYDRDLPAADYSTVMCESVKQDIARVINRHCKNDRMKEIVRLRYGFADGSSWTLESIATRFNLTKERIRQVLDEQFLPSIRNNIDSINTLKPYLGQPSLRN